MDLAKIILLASHLKDTNSIYKYVKNQHLSLDYFKIITEYHNEYTKRDTSINKR